MFGRAEGRRLNELRLAAVEDWLAARIDAGAAARRCPSWRRTRRRTRCGSAGGRCWSAPMRPATTRRPRWMPWTGPGGCSPMSWASTRARSCAPCRPGSWPRTPRCRPGPSCRRPWCRRRPRWSGEPRSMAALEEQWRAAVSGPGRRVLLTGEPGSGRWRLAGELAVRVHRQRAAVMLGGPRCSGRGPALRVVDARAATARGARRSAGPGSCSPGRGRARRGRARRCRGPHAAPGCRAGGQLLSSYLPDGSAC